MYTHISEGNFSLFSIFFFSASEIFGRETDVQYLRLYSATFILDQNVMFSSSRNSWYILHILHVYYISYTMYVTHTVCIYIHI